MDATLCNPVLLRLIIAYQHGWWPDSRGFRDDPLIFASSNLKEQVAAFGDRFAPWLARHGLDGVIDLMQLYPPLAPCIALHAAATGNRPLGAAAIAASSRFSYWAELMGNTALLHGHYDLFKADGIRVSVQAALQSGNEALVRRLYAERPQDVADNIEAAIQSGHLPIVRFLHEETDVLQTVDVLELAAKHGHYNMVVYLAGEGYDGDFCLLDYPAADGRLDILQFLHEVLPDKRLESALVAAARRGHGHIVAYLLANGTSSTKALELAAKHGHLDCCQQLLAYERTAHPTRVLPVSVMVAAVTGGNNAIIELLHPVQIWPHEYMDTCARLGRLDLVASLHNPGYFTCSKAAMDGAATNGHLAVVQFLKDHRVEGCSTSAIDGAAGNGHMDVVVFLHGHCNGNASSYALAWAAMGGHDLVVRYLHNVMKAPVLDDAPERAARGGHLKAVRYLHEEGLGQWTSRVMDLAAASGNCDLVAFLHTHRSEGCSAAAMNGAVEHGHLEVVRYLHEVAGMTCSESAVRSAIQRGHASLLRYLDASGVDLLEHAKARSPPAKKQRTSTYGHVPS
ncbi:hypothetical protein SPRG_13022 [Saprolegnia parasitica CBS 223.65]|uniref:Uncharacterized protein n=1 Tax=Saprolegnia parasitica (strain CBS 223.65) TaxID=695850 RepID=A0A067BT81_SAPPC|nr:hypothetical protein SPRG_13022 [Saprolegnia parasitica CBS 223.65]KDO21684.1 hypothetical protein SPRG_13022 [Saprolegnia parasitica CBS 223.65]|eukprot:XP_012207606.1 hypothetical protein SPRG_13022 [Saprolegnia parasitica CBS 223.65]